jgi:hypothetical protein
LRINAVRFVGNAVKLLAKKQGAWPAGCGLRVDRASSATAGEPFAGIGAVRPDVAAIGRGTAFVCQASMSFAKGIRSGASRGGIIGPVAATG